MMKRWISMLLALMLLMLGMATAEDAADDAWEYELVGRAIELVRQMDAQERGPAGPVFPGKIPARRSGRVPERRSMPRRSGRLCRGPPTRTQPRRTKRC